MANKPTRDRTDPLWVVFAERLKHERLRRGLDQVELAELVGVSLRTLRNRENGYAWPKKKTALKLICWAYGKELKND